MNSSLPVNACGVVTDRLYRPQDARQVLSGAVLNMIRFK